jgi:hypothetical protein
MRHKLFTASLLMGFLSAFVVSGAAQKSQQDPQDQTTPGQSKPGMTDGGMVDRSAGQGQAMMGCCMMGTTSQMTPRHQQMSMLMDKLMESMAAIQNEKDPEALKSMLAKHQALLNQMHSHITQQAKMMQMMADHCPMVGDVSKAPSQ